MPISISSKVLKQQAKTLVKHWPFADIKTTHARTILSQLYGYKDNHHYQKCSAETLGSLIPCNKDVVLSHYLTWVKKLAKLGLMNEIQAKNALHKLWPAYLNDELAFKGKTYKASFQFFGQCQDFIGEDLHDKPIEYAFNDKPSIKDAVEALGVPHPELGAIKVNQHYVDFNYALNDGDEVSVFPLPYQDESVALLYMPKQGATFLLDVHLGGLARYLRIAGFNCLFETKDHGDALLAEVAAKENLTLLTRDIGLLKRAKVKYARWVRNVLPEAQFKEIVEHYQLAGQFKPMTRCVKCNGAINSVTKQSVKDEVPKGVLEWQDDFSRCNCCEQVYWKGTHYDKINDILANVRS